MEVKQIDLVSDRVLMQRYMKGSLCFNLFGGDDMTRAKLLELNKKFHHTEGEE